MKTLKIVLLQAAMLTALVSIGQTKKAAWKEMKAFHEVMAATFHPAEEGNVEPLKKRSGELVTKAAAWSKSVYPTGYNKKEIAPVLKQLTAEATYLDSRVKANAPNDEITKYITALHTRFHEVAEKCGAGEHEGH